MKIIYQILLLLVLLPQINCEADVFSCYQNQNITMSTTYLCGLSCKNWWYYEHRFNITPSHTCVIKPEYFKQFKVINTCPGYTAKYSSALYDSYRSCSYNATDIVMESGQTISNYGLCDVEVVLTGKDVPVSGECNYITVLSTMRALSLSFGTFSAISSVLVFSA